MVVIDMSNGLSPPREDQKGIARSTQVSEHKQSQSKGEETLHGNNSATINSDMLRNLIQTEANNQQCLRELESRIQMLESSNKEPGSRKENIIISSNTDCTKFHG